MAKITNNDIKKSLREQIVPMLEAHKRQIAILSKKEASVADRIAPEKPLVKNDYCPPGVPGAQMAKDELGQGCPGCKAPLEKLGSIGGMSHLLCGRCGSSFSHPEHVVKNVLDENEANGDDLTKASTQGQMNVSVKSKPATNFSQIKPTAGPKPSLGTGTMVGGTAPAPSRSVPGKHLAAKAASVQKVNNVVVPGTTPAAPMARSPQVMPAVKAPAQAAAPMAAPVPNRAPQNMTARPMHSPPISGAEKKAAGIGFLANMLAKFHGKGSATWQNLAGAGASPQRAVQAMGNRMALSEMDVEKASSEAQMNIGVSSKPVTANTKNPVKKPKRIKPNYARGPETPHKCTSSCGSFCTAGDW